MTHAALASAVIFWLVVFMTLLLVTFLGVVIATPRQALAPGQPPAPEPPAPTPGPPALPPQPPAGPSPEPASPAGILGQPTVTGYAARHTPAAARGVPTPQAPGAPSQRPTQGRRFTGPALTGLALTGSALAMIGGLMFRSKTPGTLACSHHAAAICSQGFVVLTAAQLLGGVMAVAGVAIMLIALALALR